MNHTAHVPEIVLFATSIGYLGFAFRILYLQWKLRQPWRFALPGIALALVFVLCDYSGYISVIVPESVMHTRVVTHYLLALIALVLPFSPLPLWIATAGEDQI